MKTKWLTVGIILLFMATGLLPAIAQNTKKSQSPSRGSWLYVGGSEPGNYRRIQDAIDNASDGDTVFVYQGSYYENIKITKSITVLGENANTTRIIDNTSESYGIHIYSLGIPPSVMIAGFTIIIDQNPTTGGDGIHVTEAQYCEIRNNTIIADKVTIGQGIEIRFSSHFKVVNNSIKNLYGFYIMQSSDITISKNTFVDIPGVLTMDYCNNCTLMYNVIKKSITTIPWPWVVELSMIDNCTFSFNNFLNRHFQMYVYYNELSAKNTWYQNYWGRPRVLPKPIFGHVLIGDGPFPQAIPWFYFDVRPRLTPVSITEIE